MIELLGVVIWILLGCAAFMVIVAGVLLWTGGKKR